MSLSPRGTGMPAGHTRERINFHSESIQHLSFHTDYPDPLKFLQQNHFIIKIREISDRDQ